jgi:hypothetical protein
MTAPFERHFKKRWYQPSEIARALPAVLQQPLWGKGFAHLEIITHWPELVGAGMAKLCRPLKITFPHNSQAHGTLHLEASAAAAMEMPYIQPQLLEKINRYYGYAAITRVQVKQC